MGNGGTAPHIRNVGTKRRWTVSYSNRVYFFTLHKKQTGYVLTK